MFDVGFSEVVMIALIALIVLGPEKLPRAARMAGRFIQRARRSFESLKMEVERELDAEDIKRQLASVPKPNELLNDLAADISNPLREAAVGMHEAAIGHAKTLAELPQSIQAAGIQAAGIQETNIQETSSQIAQPSTPAESTASATNITTDHAVTGVELAPLHSSTDLNSYKPDVR